MHVCFVYCRLCFALMPCKKCIERIDGLQWNALQWYYTYMWKTATDRLNIESSAEWFFFWRKKNIFFVNISCVRAGRASCGHDNAVRVPPPSTVHKSMNRWCMFVHVEIFWVGTTAAVTINTEAIKRRNIQFNAFTNGRGDRQGQQQFDNNDHLYGRNAFSFPCINSSHSQTGCWFTISFSERRKQINYRMNLRRAWSHRRRMPYTCSTHVVHAY